MFPEPTELLLIGCSIESIWTKIQIKYIDTKNQLVDMLTNGNFTRDEWNHLLCLFNISHFSSIDSLEAMSKRTQEDAVKKELQQNQSRWWIWSRDTAQGIQMCLPRLHQKAQGKPVMKVNYLWARGVSSNQEPGDLWWALVHQTTQNGTLTKSGLEWKYDEMLEGRTERLVSEQPAGSFTQHTDRFVIDDDDMDSDTATESNLSPSHGHSCTGWMIECEKYWTNLQKMQCKTATNIL